MKSEHDRRGASWAMSQSWTALSPTTVHGGLVLKPRPELV